MANLLAVFIGFPLWFYAGYKVGKMIELKKQLKNKKW